MSILKKLSAIVVFGLFASSAALAELPQISDARVVQPPPGSKVAAAYFTIQNPGSEPLEITDAASDVAKQVEVHLSFVENDVAKMEKQESVTVDAGSSLEFKHGSYHVMFMGLHEPLQAGNSLDLVLNTSAGDLQVSVPIITLEEASSAGDMKEGMGHGMKHEMNHDAHKAK